MQEQASIKVIGKYSYFLAKCLGQGSFGKVYEGYQNTTGEKVAIKKVDFKMFQKDEYLKESIYSQIKILNKFKHPNIVQLFQVLNSKRSLYIITQYCKNGDLKKYLKSKGKMTQNQAFDILRQISLGFKQLMKEKVIHRDLKPANILVHNNTFKICDFGFSKYVDDVQNLLKSCVGSPIYMAPQILQKQKYTYKCDIWSLGIIYFELIHGYVPWKGLNESDLLKNIKQLPIKFNCSQPVEKFIRGLLTYSEQKRVTWEEIFKYFDINKVSSNQNTIIVEPNKSRQNIQTQTSLNKPKFLNKYCFEELAFRHFVCIDIECNLHKLMRYNFSRNIFQKYILLLCFSIKSKYDLLRFEIERIHQIEMVERIKKEFNFYNQFMEEIIDQLNVSSILNDIKKQPEFKKLFESQIMNDDAREKLQNLMKNITNTILSELMEQIKMVEETKQKQFMLGLVDNICDMMFINECYTKNSDIPFGKIFKQKTDETDLSKSINKVSSKSLILKKNNKFLTSFFS